MCFKNHRRGNRVELDCKCREVRSNHDNRHHCDRDFKHHDNKHHCDRDFKHQDNKHNCDRDFKHQDNKHHCDRDFKHHDNKHHCNRDFNCKNEFRCQCRRCNRRRFNFFW